MTPVIVSQPAPVDTPDVRARIVETLAKQGLQVVEWVGGARGHSRPFQLSPLPTLADRPAHKGYSA